MKSSAIGIIVALLVLVGAGAFIALQGDDKQPESSSTLTQTTDTVQPENQTPAETVQANSVEIRNSAYSPSKITIKKGTTVTWTNRDSMQHDISPDNPTDEFKKSELLSDGESYSVTFNTTGTYTYHCTPHPFMKGTVEVTE